MHALLHLWAEAEFKFSSLPSIHLILLLVIIILSFCMPIIWVFVLHIFVNVLSSFYDLKYFLFYFHKTIICIFVISKNENDSREKALMKYITLICRMKWICESECVCMTFFFLKIKLAIEIHVKYLFLGTPQVVQALVKLGLWIELRRRWSAGKRLKMAREILPCAELKSRDLILIL